MFPPPRRPPGVLILYLAAEEEEALSSCVTPLRCFLFYGAGLTLVFTATVWVNALFIANNGHQVARDLQRYTLPVLSLLNTLWLLYGAKCVYLEAQCKGNKPSEDHHIRHDSDLFFFIRRTVVMALLSISPRRWSSSCRA